MNILAQELGSAFPLKTRNNKINSQPRRYLSKEAWNSNPALEPIHRNIRRKHVLIMLQCKFLVLGHKLNSPNTQKSQSTEDETKVHMHAERVVLSKGQMGVPIGI